MTFESGSASTASIDGSRSTFSISGVCRTRMIGLPRHSTTICWPGASGLRSTSSGAPAAITSCAGSIEFDERPGDRAGADHGAGQGDQPEEITARAGRPRRSGVR